MSRKAKKVVQLVVAFALVALFAFAPSVEVFAQTGSSTVSAGVMNSTNGLTVGPNVSTVPANERARVTSVTINNINVSSATAPFDFVLVSPCGRTHIVPNISRNQSNITINTFNGLYARGQWQIWIQHRGATGTFSTMNSARVTVNHRF